MSTFTMDGGSPTPEGDKGRDGDLFGNLIDAAGGKSLPGAMGLVQALVTCWATPRRNTYPALHYAKLGLNTAGIVRAYRRSLHPEQNTEARKNPIQEYLTACKMAIPESFTRLGAFTATYLAGRPYRDVRLGEIKELWLRIYNLDGVEVVYQMWETSSGWNGGRETGTGPYVTMDDHARFEAALGGAVWKHEGGADLQLTAARGSQYCSTFILSNIGAPDDYVSDSEHMARSVDELARRCRAFQAKGLSRNLLFYGPPGTGKTTLARSAARLIGDGHTLRVEARAIYEAGSSAVLAFVKILRPRVILFDDLDRCMDAVVDLLHAMEQAGRHDSVVVVGTINVVGDVDPALLRPGRFDEVIEIGEPGADHRTAIVTHYARKLGVDIDVDAMTTATEGFAPADIREVMQCVATVGVEYLDGEVERVRRQRGLYAGDACAAYNDRRRNMGAMAKTSPPVSR